MSLPYAEMVARHGLGVNHRRMIEAVPHGARVLDVGCASGYLSRALAEERGAVTTGIEPDPVMAAVASANCGMVHRVTVEAARELPELARERFDAVIFGDVLEHLADPEGALVWARGLLAPGGRVVVSIPNVAHWSVRVALARGRFDYEDQGLLDCTHLRFFTRRSAHELAEQAGFRVVDERHAGAPLPGEAGARRALARMRGRQVEPVGVAGSHVPENGTGMTSRLPILQAREALARRMPTLFALQFVMTLVPVE